MFRTVRRAISMAALSARALGRAATPQRRANPFPNFLDRLEDRITPAFGPTTGLLSSTAATGLPIAEVSAGTRLASVSTGDSAILNGLLGGLLGGGAGLTLTAVDYNGIAGTDVNLGSLLGNLQTTLGVATPSQVLTGDITLGQLFSAAGLPNGLPGGTTGTIQLNDILNLAGLPAGQYSQAEINGLDLLTGSLQLFNSRNVATTPAPITLSGAALGIPGVVNVAVRAQVVEPPVFVIGPTGTTFSSAQVRLKLNVDLVDLQLGTAQLGGLLATLQGVLPPLATAGASLTVGDLELYADVASGSGTIGLINVLQNTVTLQSTPSLADVYLGTISDSVFFNRSRALVPATDLTPGTVGSLTLSSTVLGVTTPLTTLGVTLRAFSEAANPTAISSTFTAPFPSSKTIGSSAAAIGTAVTDLTSSLQVGLTGGLGALAGLLNLNQLTQQVTAPLAAAVTPILNPLLTSAVDPLLDNLGIGIGEMDLTVQGIDTRNAPDAVNDSSTTLQGRPVGVNVLANDTLPAPGTTNLAVVGTPTGGTVQVNANKTVTFTPNAGFLGEGGFTYSLTDEFGQTDTATVSIFVGLAPGPNGPPQANPDTASTALNTAVLVNVLANDTDPNGDPISIIEASNPSNGTAVVTNGKVLYTPAAGFQGTDTFTYAIGDGKGGVGLATVTVQVGGGTPANQAPTAQPDSATIPQGGSANVNVLLNDSDPDGGTLSIVGLSQPASGTVGFSGGVVSYTPAAGFFGTDRFTYTISDGQGGTGGATVTVNVTRSNGNPTVNPDTTFTPPGTPVSIPVLGNDTDPNGDTLTITGVTQPTTGGTVAITGNTVTFTPTPGYIGTTTFTYTANDGVGGSGTATVTVRVGNLNPVAGPDAAQTPVNTPVGLPVLSNDSDPDGDAFSITGVTHPSSGTVTVNGSNLLYTPATDFLGNVSFTYTITDALGGTAAGTVDITVGNGPPPIGTNRPPRVNGDSAATGKDAAVRIPVLANDTDPDGDPIGLVSVTQPANGTATMNADGTVTYTPRAGFTGTDVFSYTATDGQGGSGSGLVQVVVLGGNNPGPVISDLKQYAVGADTSGGPRVTVYNPDGSVKHNFFAYDPNTRFGVNVTLGDVNGDGESDVITSPGKGGAPHVRVFDGQTLQELFSFYAFDSSFRGGCNIAVGDTDGDGLNDIVVSAGPGGGPRVRVLDGKLLGTIRDEVRLETGVIRADFFAFDTSFVGGTSVAVVDRDSNGVGEVVTGAGAGSRPVVRIWDTNGNVTLLSEFLAFDPSVSSGVNIGGRGEFLVIGIGRGGAPQVRVFQGVDQKLVADIMAYEQSFTGGVRVNFGETVDPTKQVFLVGAGVGGGPRIKVLRPNLDVIVPDYFAFEDSFRGGVFVT